MDDNSVEKDQFFDAVIPCKVSMIIMNEQSDLQTAGLIHHLQQGDVSLSETSFGSLDARRSPNRMTI